MVNIPLILIILIIFGVMITSYSVHDKDYVAISLLGCLLAATTTGVINSLELQTFINYINFEVIIIILSMSIITKIAQDSKILEYLAIKFFQLSKGNRRIFFYLICLITTLISSIISGIIVILILAPIIIRLCHFLKIKAGTYLIGITICVNIGSILTPWKNIIISSYFNLDPLFYIQNLWLFSFILLFITLITIDFLILSKEPQINDEQKKIVLELIGIEIIIDDKKKFYINSIAIIIVIVLMVITPLLYLTVAFAAFIMVLINRKLNKRHMNDFIKDIEWEFIFFFIASFIIVGCLIEAGFKEIFDLIQFQELSIFFIMIIILIAIVAIISFLPDTPTALIFIPIIEVLILNYESSMVLILFTFLIAFNIGGNLLPQGSACDMLTLNIANEHEIDNIDFKRLLKIGSLITLIHIGLTIGYIFILSLIFL